MDWFRMDSDAMRHPKIGALAKNLDMNRYMVIGHLVCLLGGVAEHAETGSLDGVDDDTLELWSEWHGDAGKFANALRFVGLIDASNNEIHGWKKRHDCMLKERKRKTVLRKRRWDRARSVPAEKCATSDGTERAPARVYRTVPSNYNYTPPSPSRGGE